MECPQIQCHLIVRAVDGRQIQKVSVDVHLCLNSRTNKSNHFERQIFARGLVRFESQ